jgi:hypothetical protein
MGMQPHSPLNPIRFLEPNKHLSRHHRLCRRAARKNVNTCLSISQLFNYVPWGIYNSRIVFLESNFHWAHQGYENKESLSNRTDLCLFFYVDLQYKFAIISYQC